VHPSASRTPPQSFVAPPGFRLPDDTRLGTVALQIADLDRALAFYRDGIGYRVLTHHDTPNRSAILGAHGNDTPLLELHEKPGANPIPRRGRLGIYHFALRLPSRPDLGRFLRHANAIGLPLGASDHGTHEAIYIVDPDGISIEVHRDRPRNEWPVANEKLDIRLDPLDFAGLLQAGAEGEWTGLPAGSDNAHMHFYVGDLARASAFYHGALGFDRIVWSAPPGLATTALFVSAGGYHHHVGLNTWAAGQPGATDDDARILRWDLILPDQPSTDAAAESLNRAGVTVTTTPTEQGTTYLAADPWGITVRLISTVSLSPLAPPKIGR
jgi:catechol 2,3-dioxygenase